MKTWIQFHQKSAISGELIPACGDRAVIILDGRYSGETNHRIARGMALERGYPAYQMHRSKSFRDSPISPLIKVWHYQVLDWNIDYTDEVELLKREFLKHSEDEKKAVTTEYTSEAYAARNKALSIQKILEKEHGLWIL